MQEVCDIKQPILFEYKSVCPDFFEKISQETIAHLAAVSTVDIKIKETADYWAENTDSVDYVVLPFKSAHTLISTDTNSRYFSENNHDFVEESGLVTAFELNDEFFKPAMTVQTKYDLCIGSKGAYTPLRYHTGFRDFRCVVSGKLTVKMTPMKNSKYLYPNEDYDNYEFWSPVNPWTTQEKYLHEMDKIQFVEFDVECGHVFYVPPYWWYTIRFAEDDTTVCGFTYNSAINCLANSVSWGRYFLQQSNTKKNVARTDTVKEPKTVSFAEKDTVVEITEKNT
jgi:hypothetical protein